MVKIRIAVAPPHLVREQTYKPEAQSRKSQWKIEFQLSPRTLILSLLTTGLGLSFTSPSAAQHSIAGSQPSVLMATLPQVSQQPFSSTGTEVSVNGQTLSASWGQWQTTSSPDQVSTAINDAGVAQLLGVELLNTNNAARQPVRWFSSTATEPLVLASWLQGGYRYLDITKLATTAGWQISATGKTLSITTPAAQVKDIRQGKQAWGDRLVIDLDRSTFWQIAQQPPPPKPKPPKLPVDSSVKVPPPPKPKPLQPPKQEWLLTIAATTTPELSQRYPPAIAAAHAANKNKSTSSIKLETAANRTTIRLSMPAGLSPRVSTLANPSRLVVDLRPDALVERDILWYPGLRWRQQFQQLGADRFPVVWLEVSPQAAGLSLKPIWSEVNSLVGIAPMIETAQRSAAAAAINGGFFNRNNKYPLGAIRQDGRWLSSPILNRGAIAWNETGQIKIGRLNLLMTLITSTGQQLPVLTRNSGYVQPGIALYSPEWGATYTPLTDNETVVVVQNNQVTAQIPGGVANQAVAVPIPRQGYLLALRGNTIKVEALATGVLLRQTAASQPADFAQYSHIIGAGPLLVQNRQIVLDAKAEGFSDAFIRERAARSAICTNQAGNLLITAIHNRAGGVGPTLAETARLLQQMGCVNALNLDGGSSTSLYLGGQLLNRSPRTAARVHNGLGIFLQP